MVMVQTIPQLLSKVVAGAAGTSKTTAPIGWYREVLIDPKTRTLTYWLRTR